MKTHKKIHSCNSHNANRTNQKLQESIFSPTQEKLKNKKSPTLQKNKTSFHRTVQTLTDNALNANLFEKGGCKLDTTQRFGQTEGHPVTAGLRNWRFSG
jgi:hypothetical protein